VKGGQEKRTGKGGEGRAREEKGEKRMPHPMFVSGHQIALLRH